MSGGAALSRSNSSATSAVSDPQHPARLLRALSSFREEGRFCDAHLVLDGEEIPVQTNILAAASPYIRCAPPRAGSPLPTPPRAPRAFLAVRWSPGPCYGWSQAFGAA